MNPYFSCLFRIIATARRKQNTAWLQGDGVYPYLIVVGHDDPRDSFLDWLPWYEGDVSDVSYHEMLSAGLSDTDWAMIQKHPLPEQIGQVFCALLPEHCAAPGGIRMVPNPDTTSPLKSLDQTDWRLSRELFYILSAERVIAVTPCENHSA